MLKIAHRGAKGYEPENTKAAFLKALDMQVDGIELDVQLTADGEVIVFHDDTLDRMTNGKGLVSAFKLAELYSFSIAEKHQIPTLQEVLDVVDTKCFLNIELKNTGSCSRVVALIEAAVLVKKWTYQHFIVSSFDWNALREISLLNPKIPIGVLTENNLDLALTFAETIQAKAIHPHYHLLDAENTKKIQDKGFLVFPWTVNETADIDRLKRYQVNGIITDYPDRI
ncbi:glycerophosphodiester phosphodiesterase [Flavobacterium agrisoli]|uniref:Glycerophosphodiester phosphodiesterase n=1 Tax=Flavobacterium agrisoli TaxID=2793066 RepID=A0A934PLW0_9FLAO|nr:glycerophosphodiester phosphodiesterase family protein [Flavobacterium agrisoli]MBK0370587.1 glycerophosphodiester phosphodiesterase [Flavobacterium agrisoli]